MALSHRLIDVVKASLTGSIIGNILLVLGAPILPGGIRFSRKTFNQTAAHISATSLTLATTLVAFLSEFLVGSVEAARESLGLTEVFVGVIIVAIIGNAAEHSTAILAALKNKMDLSLGIAIGSSLQIALFVTPVLIFASYWMGGR